MVRRKAIKLKSKKIVKKKLNPRDLKDRLIQLGIDDEGKKKLKKELLIRQHYQCAICRKDLKRASPVNIQLDHSHKPPFEIRGILCAYCNRYFLTKMNEAHPQYFLHAYNYLMEDKQDIEGLIEKFKNKQ